MSWICHHISCHRVQKNLKGLTFTLHENSLALDEVVVTAQKAKDGLGTTQNIGRDALNHLQLSNTTDIAALLPGGKTVNPDLTSENASMRNKANTAGKGSYTVTNYNGVYGIMSYLIGSSNYQVTTNEDGSLKNVQYYYLMPTYNASNEKVTVAFGNFLAGASLRCVKNK